jgi:RNA polymerase sigma-70 factor (ECF subfamily)
MPEQDTSIGGPTRDFLRTSWGLVSGFTSGNEQETRKALGRLAERFWKPVYLYIRMSWKRSNDDAKDLTQGFFAWLLEKEALARYDPSRGSFRTFLRTVLKNFLRHEKEAREALRRGGAVSRLPPEAALEALAAPSEGDPERAFDRTWAGEILSRALAATRDSYEREGKGTPWRAYELYELAPGASPPTYAGIARELGVKESDVRNHIHAVRRDLKRRIFDELSETVTSPDQLGEEWNDLLRS